MKFINFLRSWRQAKPHHVGEGVIIEPSAALQAVEGISLGDYVRIGQQCVLNGEGGLEIGVGTILAPRVVILTSTHQYDQENMLPYHAGNDLRPVKIGRGVWIGWGAMIVPGITIDDGAVVAMGAVVTKDVEKGQVVGGNPAKEIGRRSGELVDKLVDQNLYYAKLKIEKRL